MCKFLGGQNEGLEPKKDQKWGVGNFEYENIKKFEHPRIDSTVFAA